MIQNADTSSRRISLLAVWIIVVGIFAGHLTNPRYKYNYYNQDLSFDVTSYYLYLPFNFIYHDPGLTNKAAIDTIWARYAPSPTFYQAFEIENGNRVMNYTCGFSYAYAPFFFIADYWAQHSTYMRDGFSFPYQFCIGNGVFIYILLGWFFLRKVLLNYFSDTVSAITLLLIGFGTNYFSEAINNQLQPHAMLFSGYAIVLYCIIKWHRAPKMKYMIIGGLLMGWLILARPSEIVSLLLPLLWNVYDKASLKAKWELIKNHKSHLFAYAACGIAAFVPQFVYWHTVTGSALFYSYSHTEGFDFLKPHIINVLFSFKKSLLVYTPILIFPLIGMFIMKRKNHEGSVAIIAYAAANFYLLASWAAWWNGGSFGMRYFAESYATMSIPFAFCLQSIAEGKLFKKIISTVLIVFFVVLNLFQTWQFINWIIPDDQMTFAYYKKIFFKTMVSDEDRKLQEVKRSMAGTESFNNENEYIHYTKVFMNFSDINSMPLDYDVVDTSLYFSPPASCRIDPSHDYYPSYNWPYETLVPKGKDHIWIRVSMKYYSAIDIKDNNTALVIEMPHKDYHLKYRSFRFDERPFVKGEWNDFKVDYMTPFPYLESDKIYVYMWYRGKSTINIDDFKVEIFEKKE